MERPRGEGVTKKDIEGCVTRTQDERREEEERQERRTENLATGGLAQALVVVHDAVRGGEDDVTEVTGREEVVAPGGDVLER